MPISLRLAKLEDKDFLWSLHRETLQEYIDEIWGWDEQVQQKIFNDSFDPSDRQIVETDGCAIGMLQADRHTDFIFLKNIQIAPSYQHRGIGSEIVISLIEEANDRGIPIRLQVLKVNPAHSFYERLGFREIGITETHVRMERAPGPRIGE